MREAAIQTSSFQLWKILTKKAFAEKFYRPNIEKFKIPENLKCCTPSDSVQAHWMLSTRLKMRMPTDGAGAVAIFSLWTLTLFYPLRCFRCGAPAVSLYIIWLLVYKCVILTSSNFSFAELVCSCNFSIWNSTRRARRKSSSEYHRFIYNS